MADLFDAPPPPARKGIGGHQSARPGSVTWLTPPHVIEALGGPESFDLDPCAFPGWATAREGYSLPHVNGLAAPWHGRVWLNPPYTSGEIERWIRKLGDHGRGTALIFARTETEAFQGLVFERASGLLWIAGRLHFHHPDGSRAKANAGAPSVLCAYGQDDLDRLAASGLPGALTPLQFARFVIVGALSATWREAVLAHVKAARGPVKLSDLYRALASHPNARRNRNWRPKVRQTLQRAGFRRTGPGEWQAPESDAA
jgi:hypothetical protein